MFEKNSQFYKPKDTEQKANEIVDISTWFIGELKLYEEGARDKSIVESPDSIDYKFLIPKHKYLLKKAYKTKKSNTTLHWQFWNEIIAYKLGRILGIHVPPAFVGYLGDNDVSESYYGALIEWFYDYEVSDDTSKRGGDLITNYIPNYERIKGGQHNFETVGKICLEYNVECWLKSWAEILLFDSIIGNTDRHQDNWQIITYMNDNRNFLSPAFDNGTSMGYGIRPEQIKNELSKFEKRFKKGYHHMKWSLSDSKQARSLELLQKLVYNYPETLIFIQDKLNIDISALSSDIEELTKFTIDDDMYILTMERAEFITKLIDYRFNAIKREFIK